MTVPDLEDEIEAAMERVRESALLTTDHPRSVGIAYLRGVSVRCEELAVELDWERRKHGDAPSKG